MEAGDEVVFADDEFPSVVAACERAETAGAILRRVPIPTELEREEALAAAITPATRLLAVSHVHWATGTRVDVARLASLCDRVGAILLVGRSASARRHPAGTGLDPRLLRLGVQVGALRVRTRRADRARTAATTVGACGPRLQQSVAIDGASVFSHQLSWICALAATLEQSRARSDGRARVCAVASTRRTADDRARGSRHFGGDAPTRARRNRQLRRPEPDVCATRSALARSTSNPAKAAYAFRRISTTRMMTFMRASTH